MSGASRDDDYLEPFVPVEDGPSSGGSGNRDLLTRDPPDGSRRVALVVVFGLVLAGLVVLMLVANPLSSDDEALPLGELPAVEEPSAGQEPSVGEDEPQTTVGAEQTNLSDASSVDMTNIAAGTYDVGTDNPEANTSESLTSQVTLSSYFVDIYEVTNEQYKSFVDQTGALPPAAWPGGRYEEVVPDHPVQGISVEWAQAYCQSLSKRLPSEAEWEVAARGPGNSVYPWGDDKGAVSLPADDTTYAVGSVSGNVSAVGAYDMVGNVWEWVGESYDSRIDDRFRILRGGQNGYLREVVTRLPVDASRSNASAISGFRCAADQPRDDVEPLDFGEYIVPDVSNEPVVEPIPANVLIQDQFDDSTSGWIEVSKDDFRYGYHPNEYFHLEAKAPDLQVRAYAPVAIEPDRSVAVRASVFVEPNNTESGGSFAFGIALGGEGEGQSLLFLVDPRAGRWSVCLSDRLTPCTELASAQRAIPAGIMELAIQASGSDYQFRIDNNVVTSRTIAIDFGDSSGLALNALDGVTKVHIHFEDYQISYPET